MARLLKSLPMARTRSYDFSPRLELMPLLDVVFLLLTFFISSFVVMIRADTRGVALAPVAGSVTTTAPAGAVRLLVVQPDGGLTFDGDDVAAGGLDALLAELAADPAGPTLYVSLADQDAGGDAGGGDRAGTLWALLQAIDRAGVRNVVMVGSAVLVACFVAALVLHALMVPVMGGALGAGPAPGAERLAVVWEAGPDAVDAGGVLPLELRVRGGARFDTGVEVRVKWAREPRAEAVDIARWADPQGTDADTRAMRWDWNVPVGWSGPGVLLAEARRVGGADDAWSPAPPRAVWIVSAGASAVEVALIDAPDAVAVGGVLEAGFELANRGDSWVRDGATDRVELRPAGAAGSEAGAAPWTVASVVRDEPLAPGDAVAVRPPAVRLPAEVLPGAYELVVTPGGDPRPRRTWRWRRLKRRCR